MKAFVVSIGLLAAIAGVAMVGLNLVDMSSKGVYSATASVRH